MTHLLQTEFVPFGVLLGHVAGDWARGVVPPLPPTPIRYVTVLSTLNVTGPLPCAAPVEQCPAEPTGPAGTGQLRGAGDSGLSLRWNLPTTAFRQWTLQLAAPRPMLFPVDNEVRSINTKKGNSYTVRWCGEVQGSTVKFRNWRQCSYMVQRMEQSSRFLLVHVMNAREQWKETSSSAVSKSWLYLLLRGSQETSGFV